MSKLEEVLVKEFRICQSLYNLTCDERQALARGEAACLQALSERKDALLNYLNDLENERRTLSKSESLPQAKGTGRENQAHDLLEGIRVLRSRLHEIVHGNQSLAGLALNQANRSQAALVDLFQASGEWSSASPPPLPAMVAAGMEMRRALKSADQTAAALAQKRMDNALNQLGLYLEDRGAPLLPGNIQMLDKRNRHTAQSGTQHGLDWAEVIADLYHQGTACQSVLQTNRHLLASAHLIDNGCR